MEQHAHLLPRSPNRWDYLQTFVVQKPEDSSTQQQFRNALFLQVLLAFSNVSPRLYWSHLPKPTEVVTEAFDSERTEE